MAGKRPRREHRTIETMISLYCAAHHQPRAALCKECLELLEYATSRLDRCPHGAAKPVCSKCQTHCYKPDMRERIRCVMRYAGPSMLWHHPVLALLHWFDSLRGARGSASG